MTRQMSAEQGHVRVQRGLMAVVLAGAATISFTSIAHLALQCGFGALSWAFPVILDAAAAYGMAVWLRHQPAATSAAVLTFAAVALSTTVNVIEHYATTRSVVAAGMGALPPCMLAVVLFVAHRNNKPVPGTGRVPEKEHPAPSTQDRPVPATGGLPSRVPAYPPPGRVPGTEPSPPPVPEPRPPRKPAGPVPDPKQVAAVRKRINEGHKITKQIVMDEYRIGTAKALAVLAAARNGHEAVL